MNKSYKPKVFVLAYIALVAIVFLSWFLTRTSPRSSRAAGDGLNVTFVPQDNTYQKGIDQEVEVILQPEDTTKKISGVDLTFTASGVLSFVGVEHPTAFGATDVSLFNEIVNTVQANSVHISYVSLKTDQELPQAVRFKIKFRGNADGQGSIVLNTTNSQVVGNITNKVYSFNNVTPTNYTFNTQQTSPAVSMHVLPPVFQIPYGGQQQMVFLISDTPNNKAISAFSTTISYDPNKLEVVNVDEPIDATTNGDGNKFTKLRKEIDPVAGTIKLAYVVTLPEAQLPKQPKVTFDVKGKAGGTGTVKITEYEVTGNIPENVYAANTYESSYTVIANPTDAPSITPGVTPTSCTLNTDCADNQACAGNVCRDIACVSTNACQQGTVSNHACTFQNAPNGTACNGGACQNGQCVPTTGGNTLLNMKLKFQGILRKPVNAAVQKVKVMVAGGPLASDSRTQVVDFNVDDQGVWSGTMALDLPAGSGYKVFIKGPRHLQKKICEATPTESSPGTYRCGDKGAITLQNGNNTLDFSQIIQLSGDLPEQDGIVDSYDIAYMRQSLTATDARSLAIGDINLDGVVDTQDYSLMIASLSVKYDEEL